MSFDWAQYKGGLKWLPERTIFLTKHGSHAYGTSTPDSDLDVKGVAIPPHEYFHGFAQKFEQAEGKEPDLVIYDIRKFFFLAGNCNPNIIEVLFTDESDWLINSKVWDSIRSNRDLFVSQRAKHTFSGYACAQLKRIETHRRWLITPPSHKPSRAEYDLPERTLIPSDQLQAAWSLIEKKTAQWQVDLEFLPTAERQELLYKMAEWLEEMKLGASEQFKAAGKVLGYSENFMLVLDHERAYKQRLTEWNQYKNWQQTRNPKRAALEARYGYDTKHGMHLVRLMRMAEEILTTGRVIVKRPDAEELLAIRNRGAWSYDKLVTWAKAQDTKLEELYQAGSSPIPKKPNMNRLDELCYTLVESYLR